jgi:endonuclease/exonuclease/phosphatase family metal-dependent hydrolase
MKNKKSIVLLSLFIFLCFTSGCGNSNTISILTYNVENLFDDVDDGTEYDEYDPSLKKWNTELMEIKLKNIARVIRESIEGGPDILCLQEVENKNILEILASRYLADLDYSFRVMESPAKSVTNVAILSRLPIARTHIYSLPEWQGAALRSILEIEVEYRGQLLFIFNNHWKSKSGKIKETEKARLTAAELLVSRLKTLLEREPEADVIVLGDLNECYDEYQRIHRRYQTAVIPSDLDIPADYTRKSIFLASEPAKAGVFEDKVIFYESWYDLKEKERGSSVYQNEWQTPDHLLLSVGLFDTRGFSYLENSFMVVRLPFLLDPKTGYPLRWKAGSKQKGFSDHLPLLIRVGIKK